MTISRKAALEEQEQTAAPATVLSTLDLNYELYFSNLSKKRAGLPFSETIMDGAEEYILGVMVAEPEHIAYALPRVAEPYTSKEAEAAEIGNMDKWLATDEDRLAYVLDCRTPKQRAEDEDWGGTSEEYKKSQPYHNDMYPHL